MRARHEMIDTKTENLLLTKPSVPSEILRDPSSAASLRWGIFAVLFIVIIGAYLASRGYIVAAMVNGKPIFGWDVVSSVMSHYGSTTLDSMISDRLITEAAQKQNVNITQKDVDAKINDLMKSLGSNVKIDDVLKYQGMTKAEFDDQVRLQLTVEKILGKGVTASDSEIADYISKNQTTMTATDDAGLQNEASQAIVSQKINDKVQVWFADLKSKAKISTFLK